MHVTVDPEKCVASGNCAMLVPDVFDQSEEDGTVLLLNSSPPEGQERDVRDAALACPSQAITVVEGPSTGSGKVLRTQGM